jgi:hypothetical protein
MGRVAGERNTNKDSPPNWTQKVDDPTKQQYSLSGYVGLQ